jgi:Ice-binding-like
VILAGGAIPNNVNWAVGSSATLLTNARFQGNIMALQSITLQNGVILLGRALAQVGAVDLTAGAAVITKP